MPKLVGINHIAVEVGDVDEALAYFERIFDGVRLRGRSRAMAFVDLGDQFIALASGVTHVPDRERHIGLVVDDLDATVRRLREAGVELIGSHDFRDPWGNRWQLVDYREIQFTKAPRVLEGMGLDGLEKSERALEELRAKDLAD
jgi:catechol 2,3-dioxygenase-like lactoylglutathione lyase family enzyme